MAEAVYYDVIATGTSATEHTFFAHNEADDGLTTTNLPSDGQVPRDFSIRRIELIPAGDITIADAQKLTEKTILEVIIDNKRVLAIPAAMAFTDAGIDFYDEAGNSGTSEYVKASGTLGGYQLNEPIVIPANTTFKVKLYLSATFSADTNLTCVLVGSE